MHRLSFALPLLIAPLAAFAFQEYKSGVEWAEPEMVEPGDRPGEPPSDAVILFGGTDLSAFEGGDEWDVTHGVATVGGATITSKQAFGDAQYHLEFRTPAEVKGDGQGRGNSGLYLMGKYEVQILDSWDNPTYYDGQAAGLYKQFPPLVNASREPGEWQTYDVLFEAPRFDEHGSLVRPAYATVLHNGVAVQVHQELRGGTSWTDVPAYESHPEKLPFSLQDHGNPISFRNIWVRELDLKRTPKYPEGWDGVEGEA